MIFGYGFDGTYYAVGTGAHNDWLEFLIDTGAVGFVFYLVYWVRFGKYILYKRNDSVIRNCLLCLFLTGLVRSAISFYFFNMFFPTALALGYCLSHYYNELDL